MITREEIERDLTRLVSKVNGTDPNDPVPDRFAADLTLYDDLGVDSLAMVELSEEIEDRFGVRVAEERLDQLRTFGDAVDFVDSLVR